MHRQRGNGRLTKAGKHAKNRPVGGEAIQPLRGPSVLEMVKECKRKAGRTRSPYALAKGSRETGNLCRIGTTGKSLSSLPVFPKPRSFAIASERGHS
jgi:hypothetical protein